MTIQWLGHACFAMTTQEGVRVVTDPFDTEVGYPMPQVEADILTISHQHHDHNCRDAIGGNPIVVEREGNYSLCGIKVNAYPSYHDDAQGEKRGKNLVFTFEADGVKVCHLGDLGHALEETLLRAIGTIDVLMIPVGGVYTIDAEQACALAKRMKARTVIPMHYKTPALRFSLATADEFLRLAGRPDMQAVSSLNIDALSLAQLPPVVVFDWKNR